jgi:hypothetical protein
MSLRYIKPELVEQVLTAVNWPPTPRVGAEDSREAAVDDEIRIAYFEGRAPVSAERRPALAADAPTSDDSVQPVGVEKGFPSRIARQLATHYRNDRDVA